MNLKLFEIKNGMDSIRTSIKFPGILIFLLTALLIVQTPAANAQAPVPPSSQFDITGFLQEATLDPVNITDPLAGGTLKVNGHFVVVPKNTIVILSANALTWQELFTQAPAPYGLTTAAGVPETGMALNDTPRPLATYEVEVIGNYINTTTADLYIAGLIYINQEGLNSGSGFINYINYTLAEMRIGGRIDDPNTGTRVRINDPPRADLGGKGRYSRGQSPDPRFTVDQDNPTIIATTGYPMGIPDTTTDPNLGGADDPLRPLCNRPKDTLTGHFLTTFTMPAPPSACPDPTKQLPFEVGDFVTFSGILVHDGPNPTAMPATGYPNNTYLSAYAISDNAAFYTAPGTDPAYVTMEVFILEAGGTPAIVGEIGKRTRFEGFSTDVTRNIHLFGIDVDPVTGAMTDRDYGSIDVDCGLLAGAGGDPTCTQNKISGNAAKGRWRFRPPANILTGPGELAPGTVSKANKLAMLTAFLPPVREVRAAVSTGEAQSCSVNATTGLTTCNTNYTLAAQPIVANGIKADQYHAPILEYILPENLPGAPMIPNNFETFSFLFNGGYTSSQGTLGGELNPFPIVWLPTGPVPGYIPALNSVFVVLANATIGVNGTEQLNALPLDQRFVPFPSAAVSFISSNPAVATVNATTGLVTGVFPGTAVITATAVSGTTAVTGTATITVTAPVDTFNLTVLAPPGAVAETNVTSISLARGTSGNALLWVKSAAPGTYAVNVNATSANFSSVVTMTVNGGATSAITTGVNTIATYLLNITNTGTPTGPGNSVAIISTTTTVIGVSPTIAMLLPNETMQFNSTDPAITWSNSNNSVGTIAANGSFTAIAPGNTTITATNATGTFGTALVIVGTSRYTTPSLVTGANLIIVPVQSDPAFNASRLLQLVTAQNPNTAGQKTTRWNATNQSFEIFDPFTGPIDFAINADQGYLINTSAPAANISYVGTLKGITQPILLATITVAPSALNLTVGGSATFVAIPKDILGNTVAATVSWNSSNTTVGTIDPVNGTFTAVAAGTTTINATNGTIIGSATVNVTPLIVLPVLTTIFVTPSTIALNAGGSTTFIAAPTDQLGNPIATTVTWNSSNTTVGTIDPVTGLFKALNPGTTTINATNGTVVGSAIATVTVPSVLITISVFPATLSLNAGNSATFTAIGFDQLGNVMPATFIWNSSNSTVGTIDPTTGLFLASVAGTTTINATNGSVVGSAIVVVTSSVLVTPVLTTITVAPTAMSLSVGNSAAFTAIGFGQLGNLMPATFTWNSSNNTVGTIDPTTGLFLASAAGTTTINATNGSVVGSATMTVNSVSVPPVLATITVSPPTATLQIGGNVTFTATPKDQLGNPIAAAISWSSSNTTLGNIDPITGLFTASADGTAIINATSGGVVGSAVVTVSTPVLTTITVSPPTATLQIGGNVTFTATPKDQFGNPIAAAISWSSGNTTVGNIDATGLFIASANGITTINATSGGVVGSAVVTVSTPALTTITVSPATVILNVGGATGFVATTKDQFGNPIAAAITWNSSNSTVGKIDPVTGLFTALATGTTTINATSGGVVGSATVTVNAAASSIRGTVFRDINGNRIQDPGEPGLAGWTVTNAFKDPVTGNQVILTQITDISGNYLFANLAATRYKVSEILQPGFKSTTGTGANVDLAANTVAVVNFGNQ